MKCYLLQINRMPLLGICLMVFFVAQNGLAQITARGLGMGLAYTALARGVHSQLYNPANLGLPDNPKYSMTFFSVGIGLRNNSFNKSDYDQYLVNDPEWDQNDIENILSRIPAEGFQLHTRGTVRVLSFSTGRFAWTFGAEAGSFGKIDKNLFLLSLQGNELNHTYTFDQMDGEGAGVAFWGISWGQPLPVSFAKAFSIGASASLLYGLGYAEVNEAKGNITTRPYGFEFDGEYEVSVYKGKVGLNIDIGAAAQFGKQWTVSLALGNILGFASWSHYETYGGYVRGDSLTVYQIADEEEEAIEDSSWTLESGDSFSRKLPTVIRLGCAYQTGRFTFTTDYVQSFCQDAWVTKKPQFALGMEWQGLRWLPLRAGFVTGGKFGPGTSFGIGIRPGGFILDIGVMNGGFLTPNSAKGYVLALEFGMELN